MCAALVDGFPAAGLAAAEKILQAAVTDRLWPGAVAAVGVGEQVQRRWVVGEAESWAGGHRPMGADTVFDLASLTKVLVTAPSVLVLIEQAQLGLDEPAGRYLPDLDGRISIRQLLTHTAGLAPHQDFAGTVHSPAELIAACLAEPLQAEPGTAVAYSDLGFVLLGGIVEAVSGLALASFAEQQLFAPLGSDATFDPPAAWLHRIAATEIVAGRPVHGRVHDENAAAAGAAVGHAGLFADLDAACRVVAGWLPGTVLFADRLRAEAMRDQTAALGDHRGLGWTCRGDSYDILSEGWGQDAVSHTGFTGTSVAIEPGSASWAVLLTNAVHFGRGRTEALTARRRFHQALVTPD